MNKKNNADDPHSACNTLIANTRSLQLATLGKNGFPHCGYTPFVASPFIDALAATPASTDPPPSDVGRCFYIFVSELAMHTRDLLDNQLASIMIIEDEAATKQIFARTRVYFECEAELLAASDENYNEVLDYYQQRHGKMVGLLRELPDFRLFALRPQHGQFVMGFGKAFKLTGPGLREFEHSRRA